MTKKKKIAVVIGFVSVCIIICFALMYGKMDIAHFEAEGHSYNRMKIFGITDYQIIHDPNCKCIKKI